MSNPIRVVHIMGKMVGGGVESVVMNYYRHINHDKLQFDFIVDSDSTIVPADEIRCLGGRVFEVPPYQNLIDYMKALDALFRSHDWKIVHSHINTLSVFPLYAAKKAGIPVRIAHSHATMGKGETKRNIIKVILRCFANRYPTTRFACSNYAGKWLFGDGTSFTVVPNGVDVARYRFDAQNRIAARCEWGASDTCCVVGNLGRMESAKNQVFLVDAFAYLHKVHPDSMLVIAGCGSLRGVLERKAQELDLDSSVRFLGQVEDPSQIYPGMDVFVMPSLYEGFGMALLEAQISGVRCVASNRISSEAILSDNCIIMALEDGPKAWAEAIWAQHEGGGCLGLSDVDLERFDIKSSAGKLYELYMGLYKEVTE